jgi:hypothetical protein
MTTHSLLLLSALLGAAAPTQPDYSIQAIRYGTIANFPVASLVIGAPKDEKMDIAMVIWLIRGGGHSILFDTGFHREVWLKRFPTRDYLRPDEAVKLAGVKPEDVTRRLVLWAHSPTSVAGRRIPLIRGGGV